MYTNNTRIAHNPNVMPCQNSSPSCFYPATSKQRVQVADETLPAMPNFGISTQAFVIISHYSNENIGEFDSVGIRGFYLSFNAA